MNQAEIMTLIGSKVPAKKIRLAIMAGKLSGILNAADRQISRAENFSENADWSEMLRIMEGTLEKEHDHRADDGDSIPVHDRGRKGQY
jgi:hypothetical protein